MMIMSTEKQRLDYRPTDAKVRDFDIQYAVEMYTDTMPEFRKIHQEKRNCYFPDEYKLHWHNLYSEPNCVTECTWLYAKAKCQCVPWFLRHFFEGALICELYGNRCFRNIMKSRNDILDKTGCSLTCLEDCHKYEFQSKRQFHKLERDCSLTEKIGSLPMVPMMASPGLITSLTSKP